MPETQERQSANGKGLMLGAVAYLSLSAATIHLWAMTRYFEVWWGYGAFFLVIASAQGLYCVALMRYGLRRTLFLLGLVGNLAILALWLATRAVGVPFFGPRAWEVEVIGVLDSAASGAELALVLALIILVDNEHMTIWEAIGYLVAIVGCTALVLGIPLRNVILHAGGP